MATKYPMPNHLGWFWAKMMMSDWDDELASKRWEIVEVVDNNGPAGTMDEFRVSVSGCARSESRENFFWGPAIEMPAEIAQVSA